MANLYHYVSLHSAQISFRHLVCCPLAIGSSVHCDVLALYRDICYYLLASSALYLVTLPSECNGRIVKEGK